MKVLQTTIFWVLALLLAPVLSGCFAMNSAPTESGSRDFIAPSYPKGQDSFTTTETTTQSDTSQQEQPTSGQEPGRVDSAPNRDGLLEKQNTENNSPPSSNFYDTLEEADLYRVVGQTLYMLNTYKGFMVYDLSNPSALKKRSHPPCLWCAC